MRNSIFRWKNDILSLSPTFSPIFPKNLIGIYQPLLNNGITSTKIPLKAEYDIAWLNKCQIEIVMPTFTFNDLQKQPYKYADIKILRKVDLILWNCTIVTMQQSSVDPITQQRCLVIGGPQNAGSVSVLGRAFKRTNVYGVGARR